VALCGLVAATEAVDYGSYFRMPSPYRYACVDNSNCVRYDRNQEPPHNQMHQENVSPTAARHFTNEEHMHGEQYNTLAECQLTCGEYGALWPRPSNKVELSKRTVPFTPRNLQFTKLSASNMEVQQMLEEASHYFRRNLQFMHPDYPEQSKGPFKEYDEEFMNNYQEYQYQNEKKMKPRYERKSPFNKQESSLQAQKQYFDVEVTVTQPDTQLDLKTDESYDMTVQTRGDTTTAAILASTYYGARHALESLSQLIAYDEINNSLMVVNSAIISDEPAFPYRGLMLDTGRNFYPKEEIMSLMDTMATNKLNTFHWHISDSASFPMYSQRQPQMTYYGAYSPSKVYYPDDIREIVKYANLRGIRVIPELDAPAHTGAGWNFAEQKGMDKLVLCNDQDTPWFDECKEPPCGQLNPTNPEVYNVLSDLYKDIVDAFNPDFVHMGGDDTSFKCWAQSPEIINFLQRQQPPKEVNSRELFELWNTFQNNAYTRLLEATEGKVKSVKPMIYSSSFVRNFIDPKQYIVQLTNNVNDSYIETYLNNGYQVVFSNADRWNFEGPAQSWVSHTASVRDSKMSPNPSWEHVYENSPLDMLTGMGNPTARPEHENLRANERQQVLGGEGMIWSYETDQASLQTTTWPRGAALAERLWADPITPTNREFRADQVRSRMAAHRERMVERGTRAETFQPEYCNHHQDSCYSQEEYEARQGTRNQRHLMG